VIIPEENERDLVEIPKNIKQNLEIIPVRWIDQVLEIALTRMPESKPEEEMNSGTASKPKLSSRKKAVKKGGGLTRH